MARSDLQRGVGSFGPKFYLAHRGAEGLCLLGAGWERALWCPVMPACFARYGQSWMFAEGADQPLNFLW